MASILVTGASGFIGRHLVNLLREQNHEVVGISTSESNTWIKCDLCDRDRVIEVINQVNPDVIIHLAALSSVTSGNTIDYYRINLVGTENLMQAIDLQGKRKRIIFVSTAGVYGNQKTHILSEDLAPLPVSHYGISKYACERVILNYCSRHDITIARPFNVIGLGQAEDFIMPKIVKHFVEGATKIRLGRLDPVRDYIDVYSCCDILAALIDKPLSFGEVINVCSGIGTSVQQLIDIVEEISGRNIEVISAPEFIRQNEVFSLLGSTEKLCSILPKCKVSQSFHKVISEMLENGLITHTSIVSNL